MHTLVEDFYITDVNMRPPLVDPLSWRLAIEGAVERPLILSLEEIAAMGTEEFDAVLVCVHNRLGWADWATNPGSVPRWPACSKWQAPTRMRSLSSPDRSTASSRAGR